MRNFIDNVVLWVIIFVSLGLILWILEKSDLLK